MPTPGNEQTDNVHALLFSNITQAGTENSVVLLYGLCSSTEINHPLQPPGKYYGVCSSTIMQAVRVYALQYNLAHMEHNPRFQHTSCRTTYSTLLSYALFSTTLVGQQQSHLYIHLWSNKSNGVISYRTINKMLSIWQYCCVLRIVLPRRLFHYYRGSIYMSIIGDTEYCCSCQHAPAAQRYEYHKPGKRNHNSTCAIAPVPCTPQARHAVPGCFIYEYNTEQQAASYSYVVNMNCSTHQQQVGIGLNGLAWCWASVGWHWWPSMLHWRATQQHTNQAGTGSSVPLVLCREY